MKNKSAFLLVVSVLLSLAGISQSGLWTALSSSEQLLAGNQSKGTSHPVKKRLVKLNTSIAKQLQGMAPVENAWQPFPVSSVRFDIPLPEGGMQKDLLVESTVLSTELQALYPSIKTYKLQYENSSRLSGRITISELGVNGLIFTDSGTVYISPVTGLGADIHEVYYVKDLELPQPLRCEVQDLIDGPQSTQLDAAIISPGENCKLRTYRLAVNATGEYTQWAGSTANAMNAIISTINDVNAIYERDCAIRFTLVSNTGTIFTDPATDPFPTLSFPNTTLLGTSHTTLVNSLGTAGFDVGMVFNAGWNGGLAWLPAVCSNTSKGGNAAGLTFGTGAIPRGGPQGPIFTGVVAHEIGHQFGAGHSFAATNGSCNGNARVGTAWEPGGGSTIMAYAGSCTGNSYQNNTDLYFHGGNITQIKSLVSTSTGSCATLTDLVRTSPDISIDGNSYTIPSGTPFELRASASSVSETLQYCWEQIDAGPLTDGKPSSTASSGPQFRSFPPRSQPFRVFPNMQAILNKTTPAYEVLPAVARTMNFRLTVREGTTGPGCSSKTDVAVTTSGSTPFVVTSQNTSTVWTANGINKATITWDVANTSSAPVNCSEVDILFSADGGSSYPYTLATGVPNNGSAQITIPNLPTSSGRLRIQAVNNIFFNINAAVITIVSGCAANAASIEPTEDVIAPVGDPALNLALGAGYGTLITGFSGQIKAADPASKLVINNFTPGNCEQTTNVYNYNSFRFVVSKGGYYTFNIPAATYPAVMSLYKEEYDPANPCNGFFHSNATRAPAGISVLRSFTAALIPGIRYTLTVGTFNSNNPTLPLNYTISVTNEVAGSIYTNHPSPGPGFNYAYVITDNLTSLIKAISTTADLSNPSLFKSGTYSVYGLSYASTILPATLNGYTGGSLEALRQSILGNPDGFCSKLSQNAVNVTVQGTKPADPGPLSAFYQGNKIMLKWSTKSEQGSRHFEVYRSADGINFRQLPVTIPAKGNSIETTYYSFIDQLPQEGLNYYQVKQVNTDRQSAMSNIAKAAKELQESKLSFRPNPVKDLLLVDYITEAREEVKIIITDSKGSMVMQSGFSAFTGYSTHRFDVRKLMKGLYFLTLQTPAGLTVKKFVKE